MSLVLTLLAASALAQSEPALPPPPAPLPANEPYINAVPDDQVPWEDKAAPEFPRVVRRGDEICMQSFGVDGQIVSQCRPGRFAKPAAVPAGESNVHLVASLGVLGGMLLVPANAGIAGAVGGFGQLGARFTDLLGAVLVLNFWMGIDSGGTVGTFSFAPGLRLGGDRASLSLALGPSLLFLNAGGVSGSGWMGTLLATGVFRVAGPFSLFAQAAFSFNGGGTIFHFGGGVGVSL